MRRLLSIAGIAALAVTAVAAASRPAPARGSSALDGCGLAQAAFCRPLIVNHSATNPPSNQRAGALNGVLWGTSTNFSWMATTVGCNGHPVNYPKNIQVCDGHLQDSVQDNGDVTSLAMYPRQPFNFANGGKIAFNVSNDTEGTHAVWPELWVTDQPTPDPFVHLGVADPPRNGFGIRFAGCLDTSGNDGGCFVTDGGIGIDSAVIVHNYLVSDSAGYEPGPSFRVVGSDRGATKSGPGQWNHYQVDINPGGTDIEVYDTNAFSDNKPWNPAADPLIHIGSITRFGGLGFSQGLVWLEDAHYAACKFNSQCQHSFTWGDVGFTGPVEPHDLGFDVRGADVATSQPFGGGDGHPGIDNGYWIGANHSVTLPIPDVPAKTRAPAVGALLTFSFFTEDSLMPHASVNGCHVSRPWPFTAVQKHGQTMTFAALIYAYTVPLSCVHYGRINTVTFTGAPGLQHPQDVFNIDLILQGAGGVAK